MAILATVVALAAVDTFAWKLVLGQLIHIQVVSETPLTRHVSIAATRITSLALATAVATAAIATAV